MDAHPVLAAGVDQLIQRCRPDSVPREVIDLGGGTGGQAVRLAVAGHHVLVVDPSPDALAALERRARDAGVESRLRGVLGDAEGLGDVVPPASADLILCHGVLEVVDDPGQALARIRMALRATGWLSLLVAGRYAAMLARVAAGQVRTARHILLDPAGRWGDADPLLRRYDIASAAAELNGAGFEASTARGIRVVSDLAPSSGQLDGAAEHLADLEKGASEDPTLMGIAAYLHLVAHPVGSV